MGSPAYSRQLSNQPDQWALHPMCWQRLCWDMLTLFLLLPDLFVTPLQVFGLPRHAALISFEWISGFFWLLDIPMTFGTGFLDGDVVQLAPPIIARRYLKNWFGFDIVVVVVDWALLVGLWKHVQMRMLRTFRLMRVFKVLHMTKTFEVRYTADECSLYLGLSKLFLEFTLAVHFITCGWYWLGSTVLGGWVSSEDVRGQTFFYRYFAASRWTIAQISGRTDIELRTASEYMYTVFVCCFGIGLFSVVISCVTNAMLEIEHLQRERTQKQRAFFRYLSRHRQISAELRLRIKVHFERFASNPHTEKQEQEVLETLPHEDLLNLFYELRAPAIMHHPLFADISVEFPRLLLRLCSDMKPALVVQDEVLFTCGDACDQAHVVDRGVLLYMHGATAGRPSVDAGVAFVEEPEGSPARRHCLGCFRAKSDSMDDGSVGLGHQGSTDAGDLPAVVISDSEVVRPGAFLCEAALWVDWHNQGTATAQEVCALLMLNANEFLTSVIRYTNAFARVALYARKFVEDLCFLTKLTDLQSASQDYIPEVTVFATPISESWQRFSKLLVALDLNAGKLSEGDGDFDDATWESTQMPELEPSIMRRGRSGISRTPPQGPQEASQLLFLEDNGQANSSLSLVAN